MKKLSSYKLAIALTGSVALMGTSAYAIGHHGEKPTQNIVEKAASLEDFSTLVAAVQAAGLAETLSSEGPFTVFAPTNAAFEKLPEGTIETVLKPENKELLTSILTYHVVAGNFKAADVVGLIQASPTGVADIPTVNGGVLKASLADGSVILTDAKGGTSKVVITDVKQSNGTIHAIDTVVMP